MPINSNQKYYKENQIYNKKQKLLPNNNQNYYKHWPNILRKNNQKYYQQIAKHITRE